MNVRQAFLCAPMLVGVLSLLVTVAPQAQTIGWLDRMFTFREDQRSATTPRSRANQPTYVVQPAYSPNDHAAWNAFYSDPDLAAQDYMIGSASKVMRPRSPVNQPNPMAELAGGYDSIGNRALENIRDARPSNVQIGEPGEFMDDNANLGRGVQVGDPTQDWRSQGKARMQSRPGDFDYEVSNDRRAPLAGGGQVLAESEPGVVSRDSDTDRTSALPTRSPEGAYLAFDGNNKVTRYKVQRGDTLGAIAAQPEIYSEAALWPLIYSANRKAIGASPNRLKPAMELTIPRDYTPAQAKKARQSAGGRR